MWTYWPWIDLSDVLWRRLLPVCYLLSSKLFSYMDGSFLRRNFSPKCFMPMLVGKGIFTALFTSASHLLGHTRHRLGQDNGCKIDGSA